MERLGFLTGGGDSALEAGEESVDVVLWVVGHLCEPSAGDTDASALPSSPAGTANEQKRPDRQSIGRCVYKESEREERKERRKMGLHFQNYNLR